MPDDRCEVVLYTPSHDATFASLGVEGARDVVDLWADRSAALGARDDVAYVLVFENRGAEVGATIAHPHGQIYAFDLVPPAPARRGRPLRGPRSAGDRPPCRLVGWMECVGRACVVVADRPPPRAGESGARPAVADTATPNGPRRTPRRRAGATRPPVRPAAPLHALVPPTSLRRSRVERTSVARAPRVALARRRRRALHRGGRARLRGLLQPRRARSVRRRAAGRVRMIVVSRARDA